MAMDLDAGAFAYLTGADIRVYELIAAGEYIPGSHPEAEERLAAYGCVAFHPDRPGTPVALNPEDAGRRRAIAELEAAQAQVARLKSLPELTDQLSQAYRRGQWTASGGSEYIDDAATVNARLDDVVASAETEILSAQPGGPRTRVQLNRSVARDRAALERGVRLRTLYRETARDSEVTGEYARTMTALGRAFRTLSAPFERCIVVDRRVAFVSNHLVVGAPEHAAWVITDRAMVAYIAAEFEEKWRLADPWAGRVRSRRAAAAVGVVPGGGVRTTRRQREALRDMVSGRDRRATASRLGVSERTVAADINAVKRLAGAVTMAELAYWWAFSEDRLVDDTAPAGGLVGGSAGAGMAEGLAGRETAA